jgi:hypothetical protein
MAAFWDIARCSLVEVDRRFRGAYYLHHPEDSYAAHTTNQNANRGRSPAQVQDVVPC